MFAYNTFFLAGLAYIPASRAALIVALSPVATMFVMRFLAHERWTWLRVGGVLISLVGVTLVITRGEFGAALCAGGRSWRALFLLRWFLGRLR